MFSGGMMHIYILLSQVDGTGANRVNRAADSGQAQTGSIGLNRELANPHLGKLGQTKNNGF